MVVLQRQRPPSVFSNANAFGAKLNVMFSSDISHFDVPDFSGVVPEAHGLVRKGIMSDEQFKDFTYLNAAAFYTRGDAKFFEGTAVQDDIRVLNGLAAGTEG